MVVVNAAPSGRASADRLISSPRRRSPEPLVELRRLLTMRRAYDGSNRRRQCCRATISPRQKSPQRHASEAPDLMPINPEGLFWFGCALVIPGQLDTALPYFRRVYAVRPGFRATDPTPGGRWPAAARCACAYAACDRALVGTAWAASPPAPAPPASTRRAAGVFRAACNPSCCHPPVRARDDRTTPRPARRRSCHSSPV